MIIRLVFLLICASLTSCQVYRTTFDCPPCRGVPCTSVSDIQRMIIETPDGGPDIFSEVLPSECHANQCRNQVCTSTKMKKRIWVDSSENETTAVQGHYIYFTEDEESESCR